MALESGTYVKDLVSTNPPGTDAISQGDDHIRLIKSVLKNSFPSNSNAPIVPDISGNGDKYLQVNSGATATHWVTLDVDSLTERKGEFSRPTFSYSGSTLTVSPGYYHMGAKGYNVSWDSDITVTTTSTGWRYIYLDDSAITTKTVSAGQIIESGTAPSYNSTYHGWYNGNDRCIFAVYATGGTITSFYHSGDTFVQYLTDQAADTNNQSSGAYAVFCPQIGTGVEIFGEVTIALKSPTGSTSGSTFYAASYVGTGQLIGTVEAGDGTYDDEHVASNKRIATYDSGSARYIYITKSGGATANNWNGYTNGWYLPMGM